MATKKKVSRKAPSGPTTSLLVQMMNDMNSKLHQIHKDVQKNKNDISNMKQEIAFGKGGVKALIWIAGIVSTIIGGFTFGSHDVGYFLFDKHVYCLSWIYSFNFMGLE